MEILDMLMESDCFEMANLETQDAGLPFDIWLDSAGCKRNVPHNTPRIKVNVDGNLIPILFSETDITPTKEFRHKNEIIDWINQNREILLKHWNKELTDREVLNLLAKK